jgi:predicted N-acetyltransferase YhbS
MAAGARYGVDLRGAVPADYIDIARLLQQLGHAIDARDMSERLEAATSAPDHSVLVATAYDGHVIGLIATHWCVTLAQKRRVAEISTLVVDQQETRRGIGRMLVKAASQAARSAGCEVVTVSAAPECNAAVAFLQAIGFSASGVSLSRSLRKRPV